ncbi:MAG: DUF2125 domain-containing protein [Pseudomonadota bacterium]
MSLNARLLATAATATLVAAGPAAADLTANDVWSSWQKTMTEMGQTVDVASVSQTGERLTLDGVTVSMLSPDADFTVLVDQIVLAEETDGTVAISVSPEYALKLSTLSVDGDDVEVDMTLSNEGLELTASGDPDAISYAYAVRRLALNLDSATEDGEPLDMTISVGFDTVTGTYDVTAGDPQNVASILNAAAVAATIDVNEPEEEVDFTMAFSMEGFSTSSSGTMSPFAGAQTLPALLRSGMSSEGTATYGPSRYNIDTVTPDGQVVVQGSAGSGAFDVRLNEDGMRYSVGNTDVAINLTAPGALVPPIDFNVARSQVEFEMPLISSDDPKPLGMKLELDGLVLGDAVWSMIDPTGGLPRDPASLLVDLSGMGNWFIDVADPEAFATLEGSGALPGQLDNVDINTVELSVAGADLTGSGAFSFNNETLPPAPSGQVDLQLVGSNALIDNLVGIGLIPQDQAMAARMMLGLFARPGEGEDTLVSTIEVREDGAVLANGQRIR